MIKVGDENMKKVVILGAGIEAKVIANTLAENSDFDIYVIGNPNTSNLTQYSKVEIPGITSHEVNISYEKSNDIGDYSNYHDKVSSLMNIMESTISYSKIGSKDKVYLIKNKAEFNSRVTSVNLALSKIKLNENEKTVYFETDEGQEDLPFNYDLLINTIPLKNFLSYTDYDCSGLEFKYKMIYEISIPNIDFNREEVDNIVVFYDADPSSQFYRHNSYCSGTNVISLSSFTLSRIESSKIIYPGKIVKTEILDSVVNNLEYIFPSLKMIGSFARWDYNFGIEKVYECAKNLIKN